MLRTIALPAALAALLSSTAAMAGPLPVSQIDVDAQLSAIDNAAAGRYWANLETDLANAIAARLAERGEAADDTTVTAETGSRVLIRLESVALTTSYEMLMTDAEAYLEGQVIVTGPQYADGYKLRVSVPGVTAPAASVAVPQGTDVQTLAADSDVYYRAMVEAFAGHVVEKLG